MNEIPDGDTKTKYQDALDKLRLPYWDWALNVSPVVPGSIGLQTLKITYPNGTEADIPNPLHEYRFHPLDTNQIVGI